MTYKSFFTQLLLVTITSIIIIGLMSLVPALSPFTDLSLVTCLFFFLISIVMFFFGYYAAKSDSKYLFSNIIFGFMMGKMILTVGLVMGYNSMMQPTTKLFLLPFFMIYLIYTIFETYFMMKLGKLDSKRSVKK